MKPIRLIFCFFGALALAACGSGSDEPASSDDSITASQTTFEFGAEASEATFTVTATKDWTAVSQGDWLTVSKSGTTSSTGTVTISATANTATSSRSTTVLLMSGTARATVAVSQAGKAAEPVDPTIEVPDGYTLVWNDEFDSGTTLGSDWTYQKASPYWVNNELQTYISGGVNGTYVAAINDGHLTITAFKAGSSVYSARVYAKESEGWTYGIFEASIKLPTGKGTWPAFWMMPANNDYTANPWPACGEIDIMEEVGYNPNYTSSSIHCDAYNHTKNTQKTAERYTAKAQEEYHKYRLEWTEDYIRTYVDGNLLLTFNNDKKGSNSTWPFNKPFYLILNLAWGGDWGGAQGVDESCLPATMEIDYVRVFQKI